MPGALGYSGLSDKTLRKYLEEYRDVWEGGIAEEDLPISQVGAAIGVHVGPGGIAGRLLLPRLGAALDNMNVW